MSTELIIEEELRIVDIDKITVNPYQPRRVFDAEELAELAESIKSVGILHPPLVRPLENSDNYEIISGERRFRAMQLAGKKTIPVIIRNVNHSLSAEAALIENVQRVDLNPIEIAQALQCLNEKFGLPQDELAKRIGKKRSTVANYLRLLSLPRHIQEAVSKNRISMGHAKAILGVDTHEKQNHLYELILRQEMSVREAEAAAIRLRTSSKESIEKKDNVFLMELAQRMQEKLGTKVSINHYESKGQIVIDYYSLDDLDRLIELLIKN